MKDAVLVQLGITAWQTPRHGDFARYVEQLTGGQARVTLDEPGRVPRFSERAAHGPRMDGNAARVGRHQAAPARVPDAAAGSASGDDSGAAPGEFTAVRSSVSTVLGAFRWGLFLITVVQLGLLIVLSLGSIVGFGASLLVWWLVGRVKSWVDSAGSETGSREATLAKLRRELKARADENRLQEPRS